MSELDNESIIVETLNGPVKGKTVSTALGTEYKAFHRIPYMKPPVGELRFKDPQPVEDWIEVIDGTLDSPATFHLNSQTQDFDGLEDALVLNIFTKHRKADHFSPVMVWFHGGAFSHGSSSVQRYSPEFLIEKDVVVVSVNYRLGVLGFLSLDDPELEVPGNAGIKDQIMALKWINKNIEIFGGDVNNITAIGQSAGSAAVHYLMLSDLSRDLFHKAILISGTSLNHWANTKMKYDFGFRLAKALGWNEQDGNKKALEILQSVHPKELLSLQNTILTPLERSVFHKQPFIPCIEPFITSNCLVPKDPLEMLENAWGDKIPTLIGATSDEALYFVSIFKLHESPEMFENLGDFESIVPKNFALNTTSENCKEFGLCLRELYYGNEKPSLDNLDRIIKVSNF